MTLLLTYCVKYASDYCKGESSETVNLKGRIMLYHSMMNGCSSCPGKEGIVELLSSLEELDLSEEITLAVDDH